MAASRDQELLKALSTSLQHLQDEVNRTREDKELSEAVQRAALIEKTIQQLESTTTMPNEFASQFKEVKENLKLGKHASGTIQAEGVVKLDNFNKLDNNRAPGGPSFS